MNRSQPAARSTDNGFDMAVLAVVGLAVFVGVGLWLGAQAASLVHSHRTLDLDARDVALALRHLPEVWGNPREAFGEPARSQLPGPKLFWSCVVLALGYCAVLVRLLWRVFRTDRTPLDRRSRLGVTTEARLATANDLAALIVRRPQRGRFLLGRFRRHLIAAENPPPGSPPPPWATTRGHRLDCTHRPEPSGKTRCAESGIRTWGCPAILSSVKTDLLAATIDARRKLGDVRVFDPTGATGMRPRSGRPFEQRHRCRERPQPPRAWWTPLPGASEVATRTGSSRRRSC